METETGEKFKASSLTSQSLFLLMRGSLRSSSGEEAAQDPTARGGLHLFMASFLSEA